VKERVRRDLMALDDFVESEVGIAIAATAVVLSPQVRGWLRRGIVYGLAGAMKAGDTLGIAARGVASQAQQTAASGATVAQETTTEAKAVARGGRAPRAPEGNGK
jgi:hypothetical protein